MRRRRAPKDAAVWLVKGCEYADANVSLRAFGSTDSGVSLLIRVGNCLLFHAGDLNNWRPAQSDGNVEAVIDCTGLLPQKMRKPDTDVLNGIAYDSLTGKIYLTGKNWPLLFEIELQEK